MDHRPLQLPLSTVTQTSFQLFTPDEVRRVSVCAVTNLEALDRSKMPIKGGLYDPAMGPLDPLSCCATCGLTYNECPGHMGHIELPLPVYASLTAPAPSTL
jgi:DNA-directed RNA polymerase I subunit RPA1